MIGLDCVQVFLYYFIIITYIRGTNFGAKTNNYLQCVSLKVLKYDVEHLKYTKYIWL